MLYIAVPGPWKGLRTPRGVVLGESGFATFELTVSGLQSGVYMLHVPIIEAASRVWIDGRLVSSAGRVGYSAAATIYRPRSHDVPVISDGRPVHIAIDMAAFHHRYNGLEAPPVLGLSEPMRTYANLKLSQDLLFRVTVLLLAIYAIVVFSFRPSDRASLYFGLCCVCLLPIATFMGYDNFAMAVFPQFSYRLMLTYQYLVSVSATAFFLAYTNALFPNESSQRIYYGFLAVYGCAFVVLAAVLALGDTLLASFISVWNISLAIIMLFYASAVATVAAFKGREGAIVFLLGLVVLVLTFGLSALVFNGVIIRSRLGRDDLMPLGMLMLLFSHLVILAERWSVAIHASEEMTVDLRRLIDVSASITSEIHIETLLRKIVEATSKFLHADRSSLFLYNEKTSELIAFVAEGLETMQIHFPSTIGLAGHCFTTGEVVNIEDAYKDPRFNRDADAQTGYRTKSVLSMPVVARDGRRIGVMQALNRRDAKQFDGPDVARMSAFASQAAIAIDNATLFSQVATERNYNESILRSMSNGVITFDTDMHVAKLNSVGASILELDTESIIGASARQLLTGSNEPLLEELAAVRGDRQPRRLLDVDLRTASGKTISANVSVVPLVGEGGTDNGLLVLFEDISQEKRMQGAMRRFMTQKVVDQVLQRQDELLFGTSCVASVLFADIRNFTTMAEALSARETVDMLNEIFTELVDAVTEADGVLDKFIGDAVMAVFGAPLPSGRDTENAVDCAVGMILALGRINVHRAARGQAELRLGIGVATGDVVAGTIGSQKRMDYTVIGDSVNLASRLQTLTKIYRVSVIVSAATAGALGQNHVLRELDVIRVRGRKQPEKIFQLLSYHTEATFPHLKGVLEAYARGRAAIAARDWTAAAAAFEEALKLNPNDLPSKLMLERAKVLERQPPPLDWDGVWSTSDLPG